MSIIPALTIRQEEVELKEGKKETPPKPGRFSQHFHIKQPTSKY
jgi:hypothetical protein